MTWTSDATLATRWDRTYRAAKWGYLELGTSEDQACLRALWETVQYLGPRPPIETAGWAG